MLNYKTPCDLRTLYFRVILDFEYVTSLLFSSFSGCNLIVKDNRGLLPNFRSSYKILDNFILSKNKTEIFLIGVVQVRIVWSTCQFSTKAVLTRGPPLSFRVSLSWYVNTTHTPSIFLLKCYSFFKVLLNKAWWLQVPYFSLLYIYSLGTSLVFLQHCLQLITIVLSY